MGGDSDEEEEEDGCLIFSAGTGDSGAMGLGVSELWVGMHINVCTWSDCDFKGLEFSMGAGAGIPCVHCE